MRLFWLEFRSRSRVGRWIATGSCAAFIMLTLMSVVWGRGPFGLFGRNDPDKDKENRPWTYASGALARSNPLLSTSDSPAVLNELPAAGDKAGSSSKHPAASPKQPDATAQPAPFGDPQAPAKMEMLEQEIRTGLQSRGIEGDFARFNSYLASTLRATSGAYTGSEVTGNCRLSWYDHLLRNPLKAPAEAEQFTRELHRAVLSGPKGLAQVLATIRRKLDLPDRPPVQFPEVHSPEKALEVVQQALVGAKLAQAAALAPLTKSEIQELATNLYPVLTSQNIVGHTLNDRVTGRRMCDLLERMDRGAMFQAAEAFAPLINKELLAQLAKIPETGDVTVPGVSGRVLRKIDTPAGAIIIGGRGRNVYSLDEMPDVACVIDLGGDDEYREGVANLNHPVMVILDLAGNDVYRGSRPGIQGSAILGASLLVDVEGDDVYEGQDVCQGSCIGGVGILVDFSGNDRYHGYRRAQGTALAGLGMLLDFDGNDDYHAAMWAQGLGHPLGFGLLDDVKGNDHYYCGGQWRDSYPETPGYEGWGQGVGAGIRQVANGGIGVLLDGEGDDVYEFDYIAHGGGYWCGVGFARDFAGDDKYIGSTLTAYNGGPREQPQFQRFGCGFGCHYALGFCFDDSGNDSYRGTIMNQGFGWDCSVGVLCDFGGNDRYETNGNGSTTQGQGAQASLGILFDWDGDDQYIGYGQGYANPGINYHTQPQCGGNFSFLIDYGGEDKYDCGAANNTYTQRGSAGGFLIDRPSKREAQAR
jgi:hypothetical protein